MTKPLFAVLALSLAVPCVASPADDAFNAVVNDINQAVSKIVAAQQRQSKERKAAQPGPAPKCTPAQADQAYTDLRRCEAALRQLNRAGILDASGAFTKGFAAGRYAGSYPGAASLVLLTTTDAYIYREDCDICAAVDKCSLKDGKVTTFKEAHSLGCGDLAPEIMKKGTVVVYADCPLP